MAETRVLISEFMKWWNEYPPYVRVRTYLDGDYVVIPELVEPPPEPEPVILAVPPPIALPQRRLSIGLRHRPREFGEDLHSLLLQMPADGEPYPYRPIDDLVGFYHRWDNPDHARAWLRELADLDYVLLDVETTGSMRSSQVIEVAVLDKRGDRLFHSLFCPTTPIDPFASAVHGMTWKDVKDAPSFDLLHADLYKCLRGHLVLAYNAAFDIRLLFQTARAFQVPFPLLETACLMWCYSKIRGERTPHGQYKRFQLGVACLHVGMPVPTVAFDGEQIALISHRAEGDARYLAQFIEHLIHHAGKE
jgi:DNA polymerase III epsilon subunit-like protein